MRRASLACSFALAFALVGPARADDGANESAQPAALSSSTTAGDATLTARVEPSTVRVGEDVVLTLTVTTTGRALPLGIFDGALQAPFGDFHVEAIGAPATITDGALPGVVARYRLSTFASGNVALPAIVVELRDADGATPRRLATEPMTIHVTSVLPENADPKEFRDIKGALDLLPTPPRWPLYTALGVSLVGVGLLAAWAIVVLRRRRAPELTPGERAIKALDALESEGLPAKAQVHAFHVRLTDVVRGYIEGRFAIRAPELTTQEFLRESSRSQVLSERHQALLASLLTSADMVKFAGVRPDPSLCEGSMQSARRFVNETARPSPQPESAAGAPPVPPVPPAPSPSRPLEGARS